MAVVFKTLLPLPLARSIKQFFIMINLPSDFISSTTANMSLLISNLSPYITLVLGVILAVLVIEIIIHAIRPK